jgi:hypothetical protein
LGVALDIITCPPPSEREAFSETFSTTLYHKINFCEKSKLTIVILPDLCYNNLGRIINFKRKDYHFERNKKIKTGHNK